MTKSQTLHILIIVDSEGEEYLSSWCQRESAGGWKQISRRGEGSALRSQTRGKAAGVVLSIFVRSAPLQALSEKLQAVFK